VSVQVTAVKGASTQLVEVDHLLAREYAVKAAGLARELVDLPLSSEVGLTWVLERPGVMRVVDADTVAIVEPWPVVAEALGQALDALVVRRAAEGAVLADELRRLHAELTAAVETMAARAPAATARREERLRERLRTAVGEATIDPARVLAEAAIWADRTDVSEELTRLGAHLAEFTRMLDAGGAVGRAFDFLAQELNREINTVGSKADDLAMSQAVLTAKGSLEKMREQIQNLE
jgi:uncharacterized protein (TIGR00255 family)